MTGVGVQRDRGQHMNRQEFARERSADEVMRADRLWQQQEDTPHDAFWSQGFPCQQHPRPRLASYAQQDIRRGVRTLDHMRCERMEMLTLLE